MKSFDSLKDELLGLESVMRRSTENLFNKLSTIQISETEKLSFFKELRILSTTGAEIKILTDALYQKAVLDPTGLHSKAYWNETIRKCDENNSLTLIVGDIDKFKQYNKKYGHLQGDAALCHIARIFKDSIESQLEANERALIAR